MTSDFCSLSIDTRDDVEYRGRPLDLYRPKGYVIGDGDRAKALDAAVALTASTWGPPLATAAGSDRADGMWWMAAYNTASEAVERVIVDAILSEPPPTGNSHNNNGQREE